MGEVNYSKLIDMLEGQIEKKTDKLLEIKAIADKAIADSYSSIRPHLTMEKAVIQILKVVDE